MGIICYNPGYLTVGLHYYTTYTQIYTIIHNYTLRSCGIPYRCYIMVYSCSYDDLPGGGGGEAGRQAVCVQYLQPGRGGETLGQPVVWAMLKHLKRDREHRALNLRLYEKLY